MGAYNESPSAQIALNPEKCERPPEIQESEALSTHKSRLLAGFFVGGESPA
jgi:hypothetical protein